MNTLKILYGVKERTCGNFFSFNNDWVCPQSDIINSVFSFTLLGFKDYINSLKSLISYDPRAKVFSVVVPAIFFVSNKI